MNTVKKDIETRADLVQLLEKFYSKVLGDELIGRFFTQVVPLNLETHIPVIADFWESVLFHTGGYRKNVIGIHKHIHQLSAIQKNHFERWVLIFHQTVDELFAGDKAHLAKERARSLATIMDLKLNHEGIGGI